MSIFTFRISIFLHELASFRMMSKKCLLKTPRIKSIKKILLSIKANLLGLSILTSKHKNIHLTGVKWIEQNAFGSQGLLKAVDAQRYVLTILC